MLTINHLRKIYQGSDKGIQDLTLQLQVGDICAFVGSNGAGKSTSLKSIVGIHAFDQGQIVLNGIDLLKNPQRFKQELGYVPDNPELYENLRGYDYLNFIGSIYQVPQKLFKERVEQLAKDLDLEEGLAYLISTYSHGMKQRLALISLFLHNPSLIVLDEPFVGLDPNATYFLVNELRRRAEAGAIVIYSTHVLEVAEKLCNKLVLIDQGQVKINGSMSVITKKQSLGEVFRRVTHHEN